MLPRDKPRLPTRTPTMTERISQRFKELRLQAGGATSPEKSEVHFDADAESEKGTPKLDKGKGRAVESPERMISPPPMSPPLPPARLNTNPVPPPPAPPMMIAGLEMAPADVSTLLKRAAEQMPLRPVRFPLLGEYPDCFSGEDFATWLKDNVKDFSGSLDHAAFAAKELTEKHNLLRRVGEFGNDYENANDAFYQFRTKVRMSDLVKQLPLLTRTEGIRAGCGPRSSRERGLAHPEVTFAHGGGGCGTYDDYCLVSFEGS